MDKQEYGEQGTCMIFVHADEKVELQATEEQEIGTPLTEKELVLEQKHDER